MISPTAPKTGRYADTTHGAGETGRGNGGFSFPGFLNG